jgi:hypothetical protein
LPDKLNKSYGCLWWLNGKSSYMQQQSRKVFEGLLFPDAPAYRHRLATGYGNLSTVLPPVQK